MKGRNAAGGDAAPSPSSLQGSIVSGVSEPTPARPSQGWTPARVFMLLAAAWHLPLGGLGFLYNASFPIGAAAARSGESAHIFGIFETNGWHNAAAVLLGLVALYFMLRPHRAREAALIIGFGLAGFTASLMIWDPSAFWIASNTADQWVHASTAIGGVATGLATPGSVR